jgi:putative spermidine/putrescine transport system substrate-binding protein
LITVIRSHRGVVAAAASLTALAVIAGCGSSSSKTGTAAGGGAAGADVAGAQSAVAVGGLDKLVAAAKKEGSLNVITLPADWANYGTIIKTFESKYGIKITSANPDGSSQDEINAVKQLKGQSRAPDVLDLGQSFAVTAQEGGLLAPYKVATWNNIADNAKATDGTWYSDYGGFIAIGYDSAHVSTPPTSFADLLKPEYKNKVAINGDPTKAGAAFAAVYAAALANGGSFDDIQPGIDYFAKLHKAGNFVPVTGGPATVQSGQTPVLIWWDYLEASEAAKSVPTWKVVIPSDGHYASYYTQAISKTAPHPAAARLWEEFLYSAQGQNLWLQGKARPIQLDALVKDGTVDKTAFASLPAAPAGALTFPTIDQQTKAKAVVAQKWASAVGS